MVSYSMDKGLINGILFLDLEKVFDTVDHKILVSKLQTYGIQGSALQWFQSYLDNRRQICNINHQVSNVRKIYCGVPQGSNLGLLLFLLYTNDLPNCLKTTDAALFADDTNLSCEGKSHPELSRK